MDSHEKLCLLIREKCDKSHLGLVLGTPHDIFRVDGTSGAIEQLLLHAYSYNSDRPELMPHSLLHVCYVWTGETIKCVHWNNMLAVYVDRWNQIP